MNNKREGVLVLSFPRSIIPDRLIHPCVCRALPDMDEGEVACMRNLGITESYQVKRQVLVSGAEAAEMILRVDNIIRSAPRLAAVSFCTLRCRLLLILKHRVRRSRPEERRVTSWLLVAQLRCLWKRCNEDTQKVFSLSAAAQLSSFNSALLFAMRHRLLMTFNPST